MLIELLYKQIKQKTKKVIPLLTSNNKHQFFFKIFKRKRYICIYVWITVFINLILRKY